MFARTPAGISSDDLPRESFDVVIPVLPGPVHTEGHQALFYELHLTNFSAEPLVVREIKVIDGETHRNLIAFNGESLSEHLTVVGVASTDHDSAKMITSGGRAILFVELTENTRSFPGSLLHDITYSGAGKSNAATLHIGAVSVPSDAPVILGPPFAGGVWASVHSPAWPRGHRRVTYALSGKVRIPGRYAIDWVGLDDDGRITRGDPDRPADAVGYDASVLAGADGSIAAVRDGMAESPSISVNPRHALGDGAGNYVRTAQVDGVAGL